MTMLYLLLYLLLEPTVMNQPEPSVNTNTVLFLTPYNHDRDQASLANGSVIVGDSLTKQSFKQECDINTIMKNFGVTGKVPVSVRAPTYGDFTGLNDFHEAVNAVAQAHESFDTLPAAVRERFANDPAQLVDFCSNPENRAEAIKLGLVFEQAAPLPVDSSTEKGAE